MCNFSCPIKVHVKNGEATKIEMVNVNAAGCPRWKAQLDYIYHPDRLLHPMKRIGERGTGSFERISWNEALDIVANKMQKTKDKYGPESVVFYISYTKEPRPYFHRLTHAFGSPNYCTESSSCASATVVASYLTYGRNYSVQSFARPAIDPDTKCKILWGTNPENSTPFEWPAYQKDRGDVKLIVIDPRCTTIASMADIHLQLRPGTDGALALGMMNVIINENLHDKEFIEKSTVGFGELKKLVKEYPPERVEQITRVSAAKVKEAAILYATCKPAQIGTSPNSTSHHSNGLQNHRAVILLPALTGNLGVAGGNGNLTQPPPMNNITLHERVANMSPGVGSERFTIWTNHCCEMQSNAIVNQIESNDPYPIKALFSSGLNIQFFPNSSRMVDNLKKLDFIAVTEYFQTPATQLADIVLPVASWLERDRLITGIGPVLAEKIKLIKPVIEPVGESWPEWKIYSELAERLGFGNEFWDGDFAKCVDYILEPLEITYEELEQHPEGVKHSFTTGSEKVHKQTDFQTPSGKVEIASSILAEHGLEPLPVYKEPPESPLSQPELTKSYPLVLFTGARNISYTHSQFRNIAQLRKRVPDPLVDINPTDAELRSIKSGDTVIVKSPRGSIKMKANITDTVLDGTVSLPHHWSGEANVNILIDDQTLDPISGFPPYKSQLCQVTKY